MPYAPTLTARTDDAPVPRVEILFSTVAPTTERATVYRIVGDRTFTVRDGFNKYAAGGFTLVDFEAPPAVSVTYRAEMFTVAGVSLGFTDAAAVTVNAVGTWFHQPLNPALCVRVGLEGSAGAELGRPFIGDVVQPLGRSVPLWVGSGRAGVRQVVIDCYTVTVGEEAQFNAMLGGYGAPQIPVICVRTSDNVGFPRPLFATFTDVRRVGFDLRNGGSVVRWRITGDEVAPPAISLTTPTLTYSDIEAAYTTYSDLEAAYLTYLDVESDYSLAGTT